MAEQINLRWGRNTKLKIQFNEVVRFGPSGGKFEMRGPGYVIQFNPKDRSIGMASRQGISNLVGLNVKIPKTVSDELRRKLKPMVSDDSRGIF